MKKLRDCLLDQAKKKSRADQNIRDILCQHLDKALIDQVEFFQIEKQVLMLSVRSSAWASRLRFFGSAMTDALRSANIPVLHVKTNVVNLPPSDGLRRTAAPHHKSIPAISLSSLASLTDTMKDNELKQSLLTLIQNQKNRS